MRRHLGFLVAFSLLASFTSISSAVETKDLVKINPTKGTKLPDDNTLWYDIRELKIEGRGFSDTKKFYDRLPAKAEGVVRSSVWGLSQNSSGMAVRFVTDSTTISAKWKLRTSNLAMNHMPATGVSGLDLYVKTDQGKWQWLGVGRPTALENKQSLASGLAPGTREFFFYLPLYNGVESVELGLPGGAPLFQAPPRPSGEKPIVFYGTSITQGGCVFAPGMCYSAILGRWLNREAINLGFSGNAKMEPEVAQLLAELDPGVYFINALPNMTAAEISERAEPLVRTIRKAHPETPIVLVEDRTYANAPVLPATMQRNVTSRAAFKAAYDSLVSAGVKGLTYVAGEGQIGDDGEGTVDGSHPTDLGFLRMAETFKPVLEKILAPRVTGG